MAAWLTSKPQAAAILDGADLRLADVTMKQLSGAYLKGAIMYDGKKYDPEIHKQLGPEDLVVGI